MATTSARRSPQQRMQAPGLYWSVAFAKSLSGLLCKSDQADALFGVGGVKRVVGVVHVHGAA